MENKITEPYYPNKDKDHLKYLEREHDKNDKGFFMMFEYKGQNEGDEYIGRSYDRIYQGHNIKYLSDAIDYFRKKHGEDIKIYSIAIQNIENEPVLYSKFMTLLNPNRDFIMFTGIATEDDAVVKKADKRFQKWINQTERKKAFKEKFLLRNRK